MSHICWARPPLSCLSCWRGVASSSRNSSSSSLGGTWSSWGARRTLHQNQPWSCQGAHAPHSPEARRWGVLGTWRPTEQSRCRPTWFCGKHIMLEEPNSSPASRAGGGVGRECLSRRRQLGFLHPNHSFVLCSRELVSSPALTQGMPAGCRSDARLQAKSLQDHPAGSWNSSNSTLK